MIGTLFLLFFACGVILASLIYGTATFSAFFLFLPIVIVIAALLALRAPA